MRAVADLAIYDWIDLFSDCDAWSDRSMLVMYRSLTYWSELQMATFRDLEEEEKILLFKALDMATDGCVARANRAELPGVQEEFKKQADRFRSVASKLRLTK